eukprot:COSAG04_NODE_68_length_29323_cov_9.683514_25_plen_316_part_00
MALSPAQVAQYNELGYVCVEGVLSATELETARAITDEFVELSREVTVDATATVVVPPVGSAGVHAEGVAAAQDALHHFDLEPGHTREAPQVRRLSNPCSYHPFFDGLMRDTRILDIVAALIGPSIRAQGNKLNMKPPHVGSAIEWHQVCLRSLAALNHPTPPHPRRSGAAATSAAAAPPGSAAPPRAPLPRPAARFGFHTRFEQSLTRFLLQDFAHYPHTNDDLCAVAVCLDDATKQNGAMMVLPYSHTGPILDHHQVIPTPLHVLDRISPIFPPFFPVFFARFHRLAEAAPTSRKPEPRAKRQLQGRPNTVSAA